MKTIFYTSVLAILLLSLGGYFITGIKYSDTYNSNLREKNKFRVFSQLSFIVAFHIDNTFSICFMKEGETILEQQHIRGFYIGEKPFEEQSVILKAISINGENSYFVLQKTQEEISLHKCVSDLPAVSDGAFYPLISDVVIKKMVMFVKLKKTFAAMLLFSSFALFICLLQNFVSNHFLKFAK